MAFSPHTPRLKELGEAHPRVIEAFEDFFAVPTIVYVDYANVWHWHEALGWHFDPKRFKQFLRCFNTVVKAKAYNGVIEGDPDSLQVRGILRSAGYELNEKPVKTIRLSIDTTSTPSDSPALLKSFIKAALLRKLDIETIEFLNGKLKRLNAEGVQYLEMRKCNFDVEIGRDLYLDAEHGHATSFVLLSGDSDFADPIEKLLDTEKQVVLISTSGRVAPELSDLRSKGLVIYDIRKARQFFCWPKEMVQ